ncbi:MAG: tRNA (adenosine(37)-N6)-dimethylallyltransferase MiaA [Caldilinea sp.]|nr:tRNA (adenosine(37)-N6)-dimethylallyltransferase MiaA [Caldilinea sp.]MDW8440720.1 tRNA (adenosine(37)-N6)-dimethylallyltransferase MiaA [Caldilineaceae bacterium]
MSDEIRSVEQVADVSAPIAMDRPPLVVILGPTGVGKTELSLELGRACRGEVVSADSRQIYRGMDIGTAKATPAEQALIPHHLIDIRNPDEVLTVAEYQKLAYAAIDSIHRRGGTPLLVGGTALYIRAVVEGLRIPEAPPDPALRAQLEQRLAQEGVASLFQELAALDPATAARIDAHNPRRVLRALEIFLLTGRSKVELEGAEPPPYRILMVGLMRPRTSLYARIDHRVDAMLAGGLIEETQRLLERGYDPALPAMTGLGYRECIDYLAGRCDLTTTAQRIKTETHRYVRHQMTWFRKLPHIHWFDLDRVAQHELLAFVLSWLRR